jgi:hypothetical protein
MNKHVAAFIVLDEAIPLLLVEPLHLTTVPKYFPPFKRNPPTPPVEKKGHVFPQRLRAARGPKKSENLESLQNLHAGVRDTL